MVQTALTALMAYVQGSAWASPPRPREARLLRPMGSTAASVLSQT